MPVDQGFRPDPTKDLAFLPSSIPGSERRKEAAGRVREFLESGCPSPHADDLIQSSQNNSRLMQKTIYIYI